MAPEYPFSSFNVSATNYTGPIISYIPYLSLSQFIRDLKGNCTELIGPGDVQWIFYTAECVWHNSNDRVKSILAEYSYLLTLWPAFLTIFSSLGPDAADAAWDNLLWAGMLAVTSGGMAGFQSPSSVPHHIHTTDLADARAICKHGGSTGMPLPRGRLNRYSPRRRPLGTLFFLSQWVWLLVSITSWAGFATYFMIGISSAFPVSLGQYASLAYTNTIWLFVACAPAAAQAIARLFSNNVELYELSHATSPEHTTELSVALAPRRGIKGGLRHSVPASLIGSPTATSSVEERKRPQFTLVPCTSGLSTWARIARCQVNGRPYRLLVHPYSQHWLPIAYHGGVFFGRFVVLIIGSIQQSSYVMFPVQLVWPLSGALTVMSIVPRYLWPVYWLHDRRGADLIVYVHDPIAMGLDEMGETS